MDASRTNELAQLDSRSLETIAFPGVAALINFLPIVTTLKTNMNSSFDASFVVITVPPCSLIEISHVTHIPEYHIEKEGVVGSGH